MADPNQANDKIFDYILQRSRTRESSTLTIATVAASASLVLLGLYIQVFTESHWKGYEGLEFVVGILGISFGIVGILYREATAHTIHSNDERWIRRYLQDSCVRNLSDKKGRIDDPLCYCTASVRREVILRSLLVIPIIAWGYVPYQIGSLVAAMVGSTIYIAVLSLYERKNKND